MEAYEVERHVARELAPNEKLLWTGQPRQGIFLRPADVILIPFSLLWGGFAIFWETMAIVGKAPWFFKLWGIPFVLVGLHLIIGRFFADAWQRKHTAYAITDSRVLIISAWINKTVKSMSLRSLADISLSERSNGDGTITFGSGSRRSAPPMLEGIQNARAVFELLRQAQQTA